MNKNFILMIFLLCTLSFITGNEKKEFNHFYDYSFMNYPELRNYSDKYYDYFTESKFKAYFTGLGITGAVLTSLCPILFITGIGLILTNFWLPVFIASAICLYLGVPLIALGFGLRRSIEKYFMYSPISSIEKISFITGTIGAGCFITGGLFGIMTAFLFFLGINIHFNIVISLLSISGAMFLPGVIIAIIGYGILAKRLKNNSLKLINNSKINLPMEVVLFSYGLQKKRKSG